MNEDWTGDAWVRRHLAENGDEIYVIVTETWPGFFQVDAHRKGQDVSGEPAKTIDSAKIAGNILVAVTFTHACSTRCGEWKRRSLG